MATIEVLPSMPAVSTVPIEDGPAVDNERSLDGDFDPTKHINFMPPPKVHTMQELNFPENAGVSPVAVSEPFQLFTPEAIHRMRAEILSTKVWDNCQYSSNLAQCQLRGFASR